MSPDDDARPRLLVVDDEPLNRELLRRLLSRDYTIEEASDATSALEILERHGGAIPIILCDQLMPGRSGTELAEDVSERWPGTAFILLTGYDDDPVVAESLERGHIAEVLAKPWRSTVLKSVIASRLDA